MIEIKQVEDGHAPFLFCKVSGAYRFAHVYLTREELRDLSARAGDLLEATRCKECDGGGRKLESGGRLPSVEVCGRCGGSGTI